MLEKKFLFVVRSVVVSCLSFKSKIYFLLMYQWIKSFRFLDAVSSSESDLDTFRDIGQVCSNVVLFLIIGIIRDSVILVNCSRYLTKAAFTVKYMTNFEFAS